MRRCNVRRRQILNEKQGSCWDGYERVPGTKQLAPGSCRKKKAKNENDEVEEMEELAETLERILIEEGLWDNIRKKRARGHRPARKGEKGYPSERSWKESINESASLDETDEGNLFGRKRQEAIDADEEEFEVNGKKYRVTGDKKKTNESYRMTESELRVVIQNCILEAVYDGRKVTLNKPMSNPENPKKKSKVYVSTGKKLKSGKHKGQVKAKKVQFGDPNMRIRKSNPKARSNFRARHKCSEDKPIDTPGYWSCKAW